MVLEPIFCVMSSVKVLKRFILVSISVVPCYADHKWSANPYTNQYFVLRGAVKYCKWSANQKSLGTTALFPHHLFLGAG
jgi:hypothetical protein